MISSNCPSGGRGSLFAILASLALALVACSQQPAEQATPLSAPVVPAQAASAPSDVQLLFDTGSSSLSATTNQKLDEAARLYREGKPAVMFVSGHADSSGSEYPNLLLSGERARAVKQGLVERGIPADRLQLRAMGASLPVDPNETLPADNRRVVITWR